MYIAKDQMVAHVFTGLCLLLFVVYVQGGQGGVWGLCCTAMFVLQVEGTLLQAPWHCESLWMSNTFASGAFNTLTNLHFTNGSSGMLRSIGILW